MPKITGPTVVAHRAAQHRALLDAAEKLINDSGGEVPTLTEVAEAMGLARSSVYLYVKSRKDLIVQLLLDVIPNWTGGITAAMDAVGHDPVARLKVYIDETFRLFIEGDHGPLMVAAQHVPNPSWTRTCRRPTARGTRSSNLCSARWAGTSPSPPGR